MKRRNKKTRELLSSCIVSSRILGKQEQLLDLPVVAKQMPDLRKTTTQFMLGHKGAHGTGMALQPLWTVLLLTQRIESWKSSITSFAK